MMHVPRSYLFQGTPTSSSSREQKESRGVTTKTVRPCPTPTVAILTEKVLEPANSTPFRTVSDPVSIPSPPVSIQTRSHLSMRTQTRQHAQSGNGRGKHGQRRAQRQDSTHRTDALPPAVAALLALTTIPPPRSIQRRRPSQQKRISIDELVQQWRSEETEASPLGRSPLDILLEPFEEGDCDDASLHEIEDEKENAGFLSLRSVSSDSIASTPSLDAADSTVSSSSAPSLTSMPSDVSRKTISETYRKEKIVSSPAAEGCEDHPLRPTSRADSVITIIPTNAPIREERIVKQKSTFKSNLTASLNALRSAAKSFSNFTAPSIPSEDMLTRSLLSPRWTIASEMRPKGFQGVPDPALRRYLNPTSGVPPQTSLSSPDFPTQLREALAQSTWSGSRDDDVINPPMIQMQTYSRTRKRSRSKSIGSDRGDIATLVQSPPGVRQREPRENSDFLRVIVLEMSMRRVGKLDSKGPGRARIWLPPRKSPIEEVVKKAGVPSRWIGVSYDDEP